MGLWENHRLCFEREETDTNVKCKHNSDKCDTSIQTRVVYTEHFLHRGVFSKVTQTITSNSIPNTDPINIELLHVNRPELGHPARDPLRMSSILWSQSQTLEDYWL